jgi:hypothetical protein
MTSERLMVHFKDEQFSILTGLKVFQAKWGQTGLLVGVDLINFCGILLNIK